MSADAPGAAAGTVVGAGGGSIWGCFGVAFAEASGAAAGTGVGAGGGSTGGCFAIGAVAAGTGVGAGGGSIWGCFGVASAADASGVAGGTGVGAGGGSIWGCFGVAFADASGACTITTSGLGAPGVDTSATTAGGLDGYRSESPSWLSGKRGEGTDGATVSGDVLGTVRTGAACFCYH